MRHRVFNFSIFIIYITGMTAFMLWQGIGIAPDRYAFVLLLGSLLVKRTRSFILDWLPFLFILLSYDFLRGLAPLLNNRVHFVELIEADKLLFGGQIPTVTLQRILYHPPQLLWFDYLGTIIYFLHFALPLTFAFILWGINKDYFKHFITGLLILSYAAWITYVLYPAAPPWMAAQQNLIPPITKIMDQASRAFPTRIDLPTIYTQFNPNPVAALPSLHAAYPLLIFLFAYQYFKKKAFYFLPYVLAVWFFVVYLGEHYVIDVILGAFYAIVAFIIAKQLHFNVKLHTWLKKKTGWLLGWNVMSANIKITSPKKTQQKPKIN